LLLWGARLCITMLVPTQLGGGRALRAAPWRREGIGILPDQVASSGDGVWAPFLGRPAYTPTLVASLQRKTDAAAFLVAAERLNWGRGFHLDLFTEDGSLPEGKTAAALHINQGVEAVIRHFPAQYLWSYNRHKCPGGVALPDAPAA
jgi:KDO2-lipid IV(A) lauroyltransferase